MRYSTVLDNDQAGGTFNVECVGTTQGRAEGCVVLHPNALGIFGYSFLYENADTLVDVPLDGVKAEIETIASGEYPLSRPLFFYVKDAHRGVIPNLQEFVAEYMSENALGDNGYLGERGLVSLPEDERAELVERVTSGEGDFAVTE